MARQKIIDNTTAQDPPEQLAKVFAANLENENVAHAWLAGFRTDVRKEAAVRAGVYERVKSQPVGDVDLDDLRAIACQVKLWELSGKEWPGQTRPTLDDAREALSQASTAAMPTTPAEPGTELDLLKARIKSLENAEESRQARQKKLTSCLNRIERAKDGLNRSEADLEEAKGAVKSAQGELDHANNELYLTAKGLPIQLELPMNTLPPVAAAPAAPTNTDWRAVKLCTLKLSDSLTQKLAENHPPLTTIGELSDWQESKGDFWAKDLKGIGPGAADKISDALLKYWAEHPLPETEKPKAPDAAPVTEPADPVPAATAADELPPPATEAA